MFSAAGTRLTEKKVTSYTRVTATTDHTLNAEFEPTTIKVTLNLGGGSVSPTTLSITNDLDYTVYPALPTPTYPGNATFLGWYTTNGYLVKTGTTLPSRQDHTLVAQWKVQTVTVTFDPKGGSVSPTSKTYEPGKHYGTLPIPTRPGYSFNGWKTSETAHGYISAATTVPLTNHTLYASWTPIAAVRIKNYEPSRTVDYRTTITFTAEPTDAPANVEYYWYVNNGEHIGPQTTLTLKEVKEDFEVYVLMRTPDNSIFVESQVEKVHVKNGFFDRLKAFFRNLFHKLPVITQEVLGVKIFE